MIKAEDKTLKMFEVAPRLENFLDQQHPLFRLGQEIDWPRLEAEFTPLYAEKVGRPAKRIRLMLAIHYLKYMHDLSDEQVLQRWLENPYWQHFSGEEFFQSRFPMDPTSMTRFRKRMEGRGAEKLLEETIRAGLKLKVIAPQSLERVAVDTTVQEKSVTYPTDGKLCLRMIERLRRLADKHGIVLRQSYQRVAKAHLRQSQRFAHARKMKRAKSEERRLRTILGRLIREIDRKGEQRLPAEAYDELYLAAQVYEQRRGDEGKIYSAHASEVACISKGKAGKKYEFGCKVSLAATLKEGFIVGALALEGNPYDGHTLHQTVEQISRVGAGAPEKITVDKGYRKHN